jgi:hypothetical protein
METIMQQTRSAIGAIREASKQFLIFLLVFVPLLLGFIVGLIVKLFKLWRAAFTEGFAVGNK